MSLTLLLYDNDNPDDRADLLRTLKALDLAIALWDLDQWLRGETKYADPKNEKDEARVEALEEVRQQLHGMLDDRDVNLDEVMR